MTSPFTAATRDGLSNLAASLGAGTDKAAHDRFTLFHLDRSQVEAMYRGDWLARKVVDIVPYDMVREWRAWSGHRAEVARVEAAERRLGLRKVLQRAMVLGRLYGGGAIILGTGETDPAALARPLDERLPRGGLKFLHVVSRWELGASAVDRDPLSPWFGDALGYEIVAPGRGALTLHPSRVVRFLGHPLPDPSLTGTVWSDPVLQALYDAIHAVALTTAGATSLMHEAKVDVVTVPNLSEHLISAETTAQLSARFAYAAAMKSINNLLLLGDGETWARQRVDFGGLPEMVRTFLQVAAGAADIPVTRLLGQSPSGLSATGESDVRNYYDMIAARQELDLRPQLERLDRLILRSEGIDAGALTFAFRPLWQLDAPASAALALSKAQATQIYAGLGLWPAEVVARLVEAQLVADGTYPNAAAVFAEAGAATVESASPTLDFDPAQPRDPDGRWTAGGGEAGTTATSPGTPLDPALPHDPVGTAPDRDITLPRRQEQGGSADPIAPDPNDEVIARQAIVMLAPLLAASQLRRRALEVVRGLVQNLSNWLTLGPPPDPPPSAQPVGSGVGVSAPLNEPLPLTIQGGSPQPGPDGERYSFSEQARDPPAAAGPSGKTPWTIDIPSGLTIPVKGGNPTQEAAAYEESVRKALEFTPAGSDYKPGGKMPDGVMVIPGTESVMALEVKYLSASERALRDPDRNVRFIYEGDLNQARKYIEKYEGGLLWVTLGIPSFSSTRIARTFKGL